MSNIDALNDSYLAQLWQKCLNKFALRQEMYDNPKALYNLGVYDTYVDNNDGTITITRQTGYLTVGIADDWNLETAERNYRITYNKLTSIIQKPSSNSVVANIKCNKYLSKTADATWTGNNGVSVDTTGKVIIYDSNYNQSTSLSSWIANNSDLQIQYKLATSYTEKVLKNQSYLTIDKIYPIGAIWVSVNTNSPASLFGGVWERIEGKFLLGVADGTITQQSLLDLGWRRSGNNYYYWLDSNGNRHNISIIGNSDGEVSHTLTVNEMPSHKHNVKSHYITGTEGTSGPAGALDVNVQWSKYNDSDGGTWATYTGGSAEHNNIPPYLVVYMWKRVA